MEDREPYITGGNKMREIKFRAWKESENKMLSWNELLDSTFKSGALILNDVLTGVYLKAVMQYTGLKDKNGKEIWESDIVYIAGVGNCVVEWDADLAGWIFSKGKNFEDYQGVMEDLENVVGNIYENPELLK